MMGEKQTKTPKDWRRVHPRWSNNVVWEQYEGVEASERRLELQLPEDIRLMRLDKRDLAGAISELNAQMGFERETRATAEQAQQMLLEAGIVPEDNMASCEIVRMGEEKTGRVTP